jgi:simple sugar transport system ATP-binding protein
MAYIPEDRHETGSVAGMDLVDNFLLTRLDAFSGPVRIDRNGARKATAAAVDRFDVRCPGPGTRAGHLSGGNLQRLILARELSRRPDLILAEQPTQGLDVRAAEAVWQALLDQRKTAAVLMVTGDLKEALSLSDRIAVMFRGRILDTVSTRRPEDVERIHLLMAGLGADR